MLKNASVKRSIETRSESFFEILVLKSIKCVAKKMTVPIANICGVATSIKL